MALNSHSLRIALKPMSTMSLNERFQLLRQQNQMRQQNTGFNKSTQNASRLQLRQGSQKNRRLALQMANRPAVLAALKTRNNQNIPQKARPVKQRLGVKRTANQSIPLNQNQNRNRFKLNRNINTNNAFNRNRNFNNRNNNSFNGTNRRNNTQNSVVVGVRRKGLQRKGLRRNLKPSPNAPAIKGKRRVGQPIRNQNQAKGVVKNRFRLNRNFNARTNQGKQPQKRRNVKPNKDQLDKDLDAYMAGTKTYLDAELDAYMSQTN